MIFPNEDQALLTHELCTYGITYADTEDCLLIARNLKGHPERIAAVKGYLSPFDITGVLVLEDEFIGALFTSVTELIQYFWNGVLPDSVPTEYLADMMDLCLADLVVQQVLEDHEAMNARVVHACVRELIQGDALPESVIERLRDVLGNDKVSVH